MLGKLKYRFRQKAQALGGGGQSMGIMIFQEILHLTLRHKTLMKNF